MPGRTQVSNPASTFYFAPLRLRVRQKEVVHAKTLSREGIERGPNPREGSVTWGVTNDFPAALPCAQFLFRSWRQPLRYRCIHLTRNARRMAELDTFELFPVEYGSGEHPWIGVHVKVKTWNRPV